MKNIVVSVPTISQPIRPSPGFAKKELSTYKLDIMALCGFGCSYCSSNSGNYLRIHRERFPDSHIASEGGDGEQFPGARATRRRRSCRHTRPARPVLQGKPAPSRELVPAGARKGGRQRSTAIQARSGPPSPSATFGLNGHR